MSFEIVRSTKIVLSLARNVAIFHRMVQFIIHGRVSLGKPLSSFHTPSSPVINHPNTLLACLPVFARARISMRSRLPLKVLKSLLEMLKGFISVTSG